LLPFSILVGEDARMRHFEFSGEVLAEIERDRFYHPDPLVRRRMEVLWLKAHGETHERIAELAGLSRATVQRVLDLYEAGGISAARTFHRKVPVSALTPHRPLLEAEFGQHRQALGGGGGVREMKKGRHAACRPMFACCWRCSETQCDRCLRSSATKPDASHSRDGSGTKGAGTVPIAWPPPSWKLTTENAGGEFVV